MVLFLWPFPALMLSLSASRCGNLSEGGPGLVHSVRVYPVFFNDSLSNWRMSPRGSPRQSCIGQKKLAVTQGLKDGVYKARKKSPPVAQCCVPRPSSFQPRQAGWVSHKSLSAPFIRQPEGLLLSDAQHLLPPYTHSPPARETRGWDSESNYGFSAWLCRNVLALDTHPFFFLI